jgi:hypothetical protein
MRAIAITLAGSNDFGALYYEEVTLKFMYFKFDL